jgi:hypothetical protein
MILVSVAEDFTGAEFAGALGEGTVALCELGDGESVWSSPAGSLDCDAVASRANDFC